MVQYSIFININTRYINLTILYKLMYTFDEIQIKISIGLILQIEKKLYRFSGMKLGKNNVGIFKTNVYKGVESCIMKSG